MKSWQQRIIAFAFIGGIVMFLGQRVVYENQIVPIQQVPVDAWLASDYTNAALTMFFACLVSTLLWCALAEKSRFNDGAATARWRLLWWLLGIIPMVTIAIAVFTLIGVAKLTFH